MPTIVSPGRVISAALLAFLSLAFAGCGGGSGSGADTSAAEPAPEGATAGEVCALVTPEELVDATGLAFGVGRPEPVEPAGTSTCGWNSADTTTTVETLNVSWAPEDPGLITAQDLELGGAERVEGLGDAAFLGDGEALWVFAGGGLLIVDLSVYGDKGERVLAAQTAVAGLALERLLP